MSRRIVMIRNEELIYKDGLNRFIKSRKVKNLSAKTMKNYEHRGGKFGNHIGFDRLISEISVEDVEDYILHMKETGIKDVTINSDLSAIRTILYYFQNNGWMDIFDISFLKIDRELKEVYSSSELLTLLKKPNLSKCDFTEYKVWVMENYLLGTGNRLGSIIDLKISDVDLEDGTVLIRNTKKRKQQVIPLTKSLVMILSEYLTYRNGSESDYLFCNTTGSKLDERTVQQQIASYNHKRGVDKTSIHLYRHTFATMYIKNGGDIYRLSKLLGHSNVGITENYIHTLPVDIVPNYDDNNPLETIRKQSKDKEKIRLK